MTSGSASHGLCVPSRGGVCWPVTQAPCRGMAVKAFHFPKFTEHVGLRVRFPQDCVPPGTGRVSPASLTLVLRVLNAVASSFRKLS